MTRPLDFDPAELVRASAAFAALVDAGPEVSAPTWPMPAEALCALLRPLGVGPVDAARACRAAGVPVLNVDGRAMLAIGGVGFAGRLREVVLARLAGTPTRWRPSVDRLRVLGQPVQRPTWRRQRVMAGRGSLYAVPIGDNFEPRHSASTSASQGPSTAPPEVFE